MIWGPTWVKLQTSNHKPFTDVTDIQARLTKLNLLDSINDRLRNIEQRFEMVENDISQLKRSVTEHDKYLETNEVHCRDFHARIQNFEIARDELDHRTKEIHETLLDQQTRSMKYNLIFENIPEVIPKTDMKEDTQQILKDFLQSELEIGNVQFHNVHRLKPRRDRKPPSIVAKFVYNKDKDSVLKAARAKLIHKPFKIYQQYPQEISERRRVLVPIMKELRDQNRRAYIVKDKLYVDGRLYTPPEARVQNLGADPGFQVRGGGHLNKLRRAEGGAKTFGVFRVKNHHFTPKNHIFSNCGGRRKHFWGISCEKSRFYAKKLYFFPILGGWSRRVRPPPP